MRRVYKLVLEEHKQTDLTNILDNIESVLRDLKHNYGEINGYEIRDNIKRLRSG